jgi:hypothetical protein
MSLQSHWVAELARGVTVSLRFVVPQCKRSRGMAGKVSSGQITRHGSGVLCRWSLYWRGVWYLRGTEQAKLVDKLTNLPRTKTALGPAVLRESA